MWFEDFEDGQAFVTAARTITEADIGYVAGWSWDTNTVHTDAEFAQKGRFGAPIAYGLLGMSVVMGLISGLGVFEGSSIALLSGEDWRFEAPVMAGDTIRCEMRIVGVWATSNGKAGLLDRHFSLLNQRDECVQQGRIGLMVAQQPA